MTRPAAPAVADEPMSAGVAAQSAGFLRRGSGAARRLLRAEWLFATALLIGVLLRLCAELGFRPILWFNDGLEYLGVALRFQAYSVRPDGYSLFLRMLFPFHSFVLVAAIQHAMGLAVAVLLYALLRHWRVPRALATLGVLPQLLDVHQIALEHLVLSDTLFTFLLVIAVVLLGWQRRVSPVAAGAAGLVLALAALTRTIGLPLVILGGIYLLVRWRGWRPLVAYALLAALPLAGYAAWFQHEHGSFAFDSADGVFLYSRVMTFADCAVIKPPANLAILCPDPSQPRWPVSADYIWHPSPLDKLPGPLGANPAPELLFSPQRNGPALSFAVDAIESQPLSYLRVGLRDFSRSFGWSRQPYPSAAVVGAYSFSRDPVVISPHQLYVPAFRAGHDMLRYEHGNAETHVVDPYAGLMVDIQRFVFIPGPVLAGLLLIGLAALVVRRRDGRRWLVLLLWATALALLLIPPFTAEFDYRYVMPAIPLAGAAAALAVAVLVPRWSGEQDDGSASEPATLARGTEARLRPRHRRAGQ
jgi:hypothetical protein